jgi:hypothetical protein
MHQGKRNIEGAAVRKEKMILRSKGSREATDKTNIGRAGEGVQRKQERGVEIMTKTGPKGAEVEKDIETKIGETEAERGTDVGKEEGEGTGVTAGKSEEGQEIGVLVPVMPKENVIQEVKSEIRWFQMELESS